MGDVETAVERYRALEREAQDLHRLMMAAHDEANERRAEVRKITAQLQEAKSGDEYGRPDRQKTAELEAKLEAAQRRLDEARQRHQALQEQFRPARQLADNCKTFLESGGASIEALEAGVSIPRRQGHGISIS